MIVLEIRLELVLRVEPFGEEASIGYQDDAEECKGHAEDLFEVGFFAFVDVLDDGDEDGARVAEGMDDP